MPQLDFVSYFPQILWVSILFIILFVGLTQGFLPALRRVFWFREFKKLSSVSDSGTVSCFMLALSSKRGQLIRFVSFCSATVFYFRGGADKSVFVIKKFWLLVSYYCFGYLVLIRIFFCLGLNYDKTPF